MKPTRRLQPLFARPALAGAPLFVSMAAVACGDGVGRPILAAVGGAGGAPVDVEAGSGDVPPGAYCAAVADVSADVAASESAFFNAINELRQGAGNSCDQATFGGMLPLAPSPALRCSARLHARDMGTRMFFSQTNPDGVGPHVRMQAAGFAASAAFEDVASGELLSPIQWPPMIVGGEPPGCALGDGTLTYAGVGRFGNFWAVDVARP